MFVGLYGHNINIGNSWNPFKDFIISTCHIHLYDGNTLPCYQCTNIKMPLTIKWIANTALLGEVRV